MLLVLGISFRGVSGAADGMDRTTADYMGMLGIVINAFALQNALENMVFKHACNLAIRMDSICEPYMMRSLRGQKWTAFMIVIR